MEDFHIHTTYSDGTDSVCEILSLTKDFDMFSITDHNNINGCKRVQKDNFISGVEFSCLLRGKEIHLLGYNFDLNDKNINKLLDEYNYYNNKTFLDIFNKIVRKFKLKLDNYEVIDLINAGVSLNKVNLSKILLRNNIGCSIYDTYDTYVKDFLNATIYYPQVNEIINLVKQSNGYILLAHPFDYDLADSDVNLLVEYLKLNGIDGIEVTSNHFEKTFGLINKYKLIYSVGSDYHGKEFNRFNTIGIDTTYADKDDRYIKNLIIHK